MDGQAFVHVQALNAKLDALGNEEGGNIDAECDACAMICYTCVFEGAR